MQTPLVEIAAPTARASLRSEPSGEPEFGAALELEDEPCRPRRLFCGLFVDPEENIHCLEPAYHLALSLLRSVEPPSVRDGDPRLLVDDLIAWAWSTLEPFSLAHSAPSWPARVIRELSPVGLSDGIWLRGLTRPPAVEGDLGLCLLEQLGIRFGDPRRSEGYPNRYASLLQSVGVPPGSITRWEWDEAAPCVDLSYERGLLGLTLGLFPAALLPETLGYNLWMAALGPAPMLERLSGELREQRAHLRYIERYDRAALTSLARTAALKALEAPQSADERRERFIRGFAAAHGSYLRWEQAMLGHNVPFTAWDSVLEMVRRKARFAADHHRDVRLAKRNVEELLREGGAAHEWLVEHLAKSPLIRPGNPGASRFMTHSLSIDGPMFDAFTPREKVDLNAWIETIGTPREARSVTAPVPLAGKYGRAPSIHSVAAFADARYGDLAEDALYACLLHADEHPALALFVRSRAEALVQKLAVLFDSDERLRGERAPEYSDEAVAHLLAAPVRHAGQGADVVCQDEASSAPASRLDGSWLQGFGDLRRSDFDDHRWAFRQYRATYGDAELAWEACLDARRAAGRRLCDALLGALDGSLRQRLSPRRLAIASLALALNTHHFTPELLGIELAVATLAAPAPRAEGDEHDGGRARAAAWAVHAFMKRVRDAAAPGAIERQWQRIWRSYKALRLIACGNTDQRACLFEQLIP